MEAQRIGGLIRTLRREQGLTQAALAEMLHVSSKAVSKWERGAGCPDAALLPEIARVFGVDINALMAGSLTDNQQDGGNMKRISVYQCPQCGNILTSTNPAEISCCGRRLQPIQPAKAQDAHDASVVMVEDEWLVTWSHPMEKEHHLSFILEVGYDRIALVRLYAEGACEARLPRLPGGRFYLGCQKDGMFQIK